MNIFAQIIMAIVRGLPLLTSIKELIKPTKITIPMPSMNGQSGVQQQEIPIDASPILQKIVMLLIEFASVYACVYMMKHFGVTYNDIVTIFGLFK